MSYKEPFNFDFSVSMIGMAIAGMKCRLEMLKTNYDSNSKICSKRYLNSAVKEDGYRIEELEKAKEMIERLNIGGKYYRNKMDWKKQDWRNRANLLREIYFNLLLAFKDRVWDEKNTDKKKIKEIKELLTEAFDWIPPFYS